MSPDRDEELSAFGPDENSDEAGGDVSLFDFGRLDRIPKSQLRALHLVHENFVRSLAASLSAYLRSYVGLTLINISEISYSEFLESLATPSCIAYLGLAPYDGTAVLELGTTLMFSLIELLLGSKERSAPVIQRKITDIEKNLTQTLLRVVLRDLTEAWRTVAEISFEVQSLASEPQLMHVLSPAEAVTVIAIEVRVGSHNGFMNLAIPSLFIKRLRNSFDQLRQVRRSESSERDQFWLAQLLADAPVTFEARLNAGTISTETLLNLNVGDTLTLDQELGEQIAGLLNGLPRWRGSMAANGDRLLFELAV